MDCSDGLENLTLREDKGYAEHLASLRLTCAPSRFSGLYVLFLNVNALHVFLSAKGINRLGFRRTLKTKIA